MEKREEPNRFQEEAYKHVADLINNDRELFSNLLQYYELMYGLFLNGERGLELFVEICIPELKRILEQFAGTKDLRPLFRRCYIAIQYQNPTAMTMSLAEINEIVPGSAVKKTDTPFLVSDRFIEQLEEFIKLLEEGKFEEARWFFAGANKNHWFSAIEFLALKAYHFTARKIVFLTETNPQMAVDECPRILETLKEKVTCFIKSAKELKEFQEPRFYQFWLPKKKAFEWKLVQNTVILRH